MPLSNLIESRKSGGTRGNNQEKNKKKDAKQADDEEAGELDNDEEEEEKDELSQRRIRERRAHDQGRRARKANGIGILTFVIGCTVGGSSPHQNKEKANKENTCQERSCGNYCRENLHQKERNPVKQSEETQTNHGNDQQHHLD